MPFNYEGSKGVFGVKVAIFLLTGFSIPGIAAYYQLYVYLFSLLCLFQSYSLVLQSEGRRRRISTAAGYLLHPTCNYQLNLENLQWAFPLLNLGHAWISCGTTFPTVFSVSLFRHHTVVVTISFNRGFLH